MTSRPIARLLLCCLPLLAACTVPLGDRGTAAQRAACRSRADSVFEQRNPADKYRTDQYATGQRDAPLGGAPQIDPTADLQSRYSRDQIQADCLRRLSAQPAS